MQQHLIIIDGYNVIRRSEALRRAEKNSMENGRFALLVQLAARYAHEASQLTVVFDGAGRTESRETRYGITVIYTADGEKADICILRLTKEAHERGQKIMVATDDNEIREAINQYSPDVRPESALQLGQTLNAPPKYMLKQHKHRTTVKRLIEQKDDDEYEQPRHKHPRSRRRH
jgi:predicted RNA-binding protein with PIN domain